MENQPIVSRSFHDLVFWQKSHKFVLMVYKLTRIFPKEELFGLTSQLRRAAILIPANIVEGYKKKGKKDKLRFFNIAQGSIEECRYYLLLANDLSYSNTNNEMLLLEEVSKLLNAYCKSVLTS